VLGIRDGRPAALTFSVLLRMPGSGGFLPHAKPYRAWRTSALARLVEHHPEDREDEPVPRVALDPSVPYDRARAGELTREFVRTIEPAANPFFVG
jgi:hypothetical protein